MNLTKSVILLFLIFLLSSCVNYKTDKSKQIKEKISYSSTGFALIYNDDLVKNGVIDKKINNELIIALHSSLKKNTLVKIINPKNSKFVETKIFKKTNYPKIFNIVLSKKIATDLELDVNNPYVEIFEVKKNRTFIAKESDLFEEEKKVADIAPVDEVKMDNLSEEQTIKKEVSVKVNSFVIVISDFYYYDSAKNLANDLIKKTQNNKFLIKKIKNNEYRLSVGPFKNFNALKSIYISLNNLGFEDLNIYIEEK